jgi:SdrD B-like domain/Domain of unknown function DUF11
MRWVVVAIALLMAALPSHAQICAEVKIELLQSVSLERQAFMAKLGIKNGVQAPIENLQINVEFKDDQGNSVLASSDPNNVTAKFFIRLVDTPGITNVSAGQILLGQVAGNTNGEANWLIVPAGGAAGTTAFGKTYFVGAQISFRQSSQNRTVSVIPDSIVVLPQPKLKLDYFLPAQVFGDDPFTPNAEEPDPFVLGVRVKNIGGGPSRATKIESAQPRIIENVQGLNVNFNISGSFVQNEATQSSLLLNFGEIAPESSKVGRWVMTAALIGRFSEFEASFTHADELGGALTSLIDSVTTHTLVKDVRVDLPGRDSVRDFLALDVDTLRTYESEGVDTVVVNRSSTASFQPTSNGNYLLTFTGSVLPGYVSVPDPFFGAYKVRRAERTSDTSELPLENVWNAKVRNETSNTTSHFISLYDAKGTGSYTVFFERGAPGSITGNVFRDNNDDGIQQATERGLENVPIRVLGSTLGSEAVDRTLRTNASGVYTIADLLSGTYRIEVGDMPGLLNGTHTAGSSSGTVTPTAITQIFLDSGVKADGYRFAKRNQFVDPRQDFEVTTTTTTPIIGTAQAAQILVRVKNNGPDDSPQDRAQIIVVAPNFTITTSQPSQGQLFVNDSSRWNVGPLVTQREATWLLTLTPIRPGTHLVRSSVVNTGFDFNPLNNTSEVTINVGQTSGELIFEDGFESKFGPKQTDAQNEATLPNQIWLPTATSAASMPVIPAVVVPNGDIDPLRSPELGKDGFEDQRP